MTWTCPGTQVLLFFDYGILELSALSCSSSLTYSFFFPVEDHFAKALGDTWTKLQAKEAEKKEKKNSSSNPQPNVPKESKSQLLAL